MAAVPQRSPLRYPGGKTWLVPHIRHWLRDRHTELLVEPFAGGAIVSLTAVMEELSERAYLVDLDRDVAAFWRAALEHSAELITSIRRFFPIGKRGSAGATCSPKTCWNMDFALWC